MATDPLTEDALFAVWPNGVEGESSTWSFISKALTGTALGIQLEKSPVNANSPSTSLFPPWKLPAAETLAVCLGSLRRSALLERLFVFEIWLPPAWLLHGLPCTCRGSLFTSSADSLRLLNAGNSLAGHSAEEAHIHLAYLRPVTADNSTFVWRKLVALINAF